VAFPEKSLWKQFEGLDQRVPSLAPDDYGKDAMRYEGTVSLASHFEIPFWTWTERKWTQTCQDMYGVQFLFVQAVFRFGFSCGLY